MAQRGRPKLFTGQISVALSEEQHDWIERTAYALGITKAEALRGLLDMGISYAILVEPGVES